MAAAAGAEYARRRSWNPRESVGDEDDGQAKSRRSGVSIAERRGRWRGSADDSDKMELNVSTTFDDDDLPGDEEESEDAQTPMPFNYERGHRFTSAVSGDGHFKCTDDGMNEQRSSSGSSRGASLSSRSSLSSPSHVNDGHEAGKGEMDSDSEVDRLEVSRADLPLRSHHSHGIHWLPTKETFLGNFRIVGSLIRTPRTPYLAPVAMAALAALLAMVLAMLILTNSRLAVPETTLLVLATHHPSVPTTQPTSVGWVSETPVAEPGAANGTPGPVSPAGMAPAQADLAGSAAAAADLVNDVAFVDVGEAEDSELDRAEARIVADTTSHDGSSIDSVTACESMSGVTCGSFHDGTEAADGKTIREAQGRGSRALQQSEDPAATSPALPATQTEHDAHPGRSLHDHLLYLMRRRLRDAYLLAPAETVKSGGRVVAGDSSGSGNVIEKVGRDGAATDHFPSGTGSRDATLRTESKARRAARRWLCWRSAPWCSDTVDESWFASTAKPEAETLLSRLSDAEVAAIDSVVDKILQGVDGLGGLVEDAEPSRRGGEEPIHVFVALLKSSDRRLAALSERRIHGDGVNTARGPAGQTQARVRPRPGLLQHAERTGVVSGWLEMVGIVGGAATLIIAYGLVVSGVAVWVVRMHVDWMVRTAGFAADATERNGGAKTGFEPGTETRGRRRGLGQRGDSIPSHDVLAPEKRQGPVVADGTGSLGGGVLDEPLVSFEAVAGDTAGDLEHSRAAAADLHA